jgi:ankyrin repeat protein
MERESERELFCGLEDATNRRVAVVRLLLEAGAAVNRSTNYAETALHFAAREGHTKVVRLLLEAGAEVEAVGGGDARGWAALHHAASRGYLKIVRMLMQAMPDGSLRYDEAWGLGAYHGLAMGVAAHHGHLKVVRALLQAGADVNYIYTSSFDKRITALHGAAAHGHLNVVRALLEAGADVSHASRSRRTALHAAADGLFVRHFLRHANPRSTLPAHA